MRAASLEETDIADASFADEIDQSGFIEQRYVR
jgi:hypothetical protein